MKTKFPYTIYALIFLALFTFGTSAQTTKLDGNAKYKHNEKFYLINDRFKGTTSLITSDLRVFITSADSRLTWRFAADFDINKPLERLVLFIDSSSKEWRYLKGDYELLALVDGEQLVIGKITRVDSKVYSAYRTVYVSERLASIVSIATFVKLTRAKKVELKLGYAEFQLKESHLEAMRDYLSRFNLGDAKINWKN